MMASEPGSELARRVYVLGADRHDDAVAAIDDSLQEVRNVLTSLSLLRSDGSRCFCEDGLYNKTHQDNCERARALMAQLKT